MDLNHDKQIQSLLCYRYTIGQTNVSDRLNLSVHQSSQQAITVRGTNPKISLTPGFSRVSASRKTKNRFNGFSAVRLQSRGDKPLKRLCRTTASHTGLKPGANERVSIRGLSTTHHASRN
jgi:hypothetical protein